MLKQQILIFIVKIVGTLLFIYIYQFHLHVDGGYPLVLKVFKQNFKTWFLMTFRFKMTELPAS